VFDTTDSKKILNRLKIFMASLLATLGSKFHFYGINKRPGRLPSYRQPNEGRTIVFRREKPKPCEKFCLKVSKISSRRYKKAFWYRALAMLSFLFFALFIKAVVAAPLLQLCTKAEECDATKVSYIFQSWVHNTFIVFFYLHNSNIDYLPDVVICPLYFKS